MLAVLMLEALFFKLFKYSTIGNGIKIPGNPEGEEKSV